MKRTEEQEMIIQAIKDGKSIKVSALAGSGKTSTLVMATEEVVKPTLYLTFNKAMQQDAEAKFPSWVEVRTIHSMAYSAVGYKYQSKLKRPYGRYVNVAGTASEVAKFFKISPIEYQKGEWISSSAIGNSILRTVRAFEQSGLQEIDKSLVSMFALKAKRLKENEYPKVFEDYKKEVLKRSKELWSLRTNLKSPVLAEHDTYMKLWQLSKPDLSEYNILIVDEFQDNSMCLVEIIKSQKKELQVVLVGDANQALYQFRGAINALNEFNLPMLPLSKSFRYSQDVATIGGLITGREGMKGFELADTKVYSYGDDQVNLPEQYTAIYRTNSAMVSDAIEAITEGKKVSINMDTRGFTSLIESTLALKDGDMKKVKHELLLVYKDWNDLMKDIDWVSGEVQRVVNMIKDNTVYNVLGVLRNHKNPESPDINFITCHKSKGLEFDNVVLGNDFPSIYGKGGAKVELPIAETNLLYVATTRAKKVLHLNEQVEERIGSQVGLLFNTKSIHLVTDERGLSAMEDKFEKEFISYASSDEHFDDMLELAIEDGFDSNTLPLPLALLPTV